MALKGKLKWFNTSLTSTIEGLGEEVEISDKRTVYIMHIPNPSSQPQSKIPLTFLFDQLFILNTHNERCAVQNQRCVTLKKRNWTYWFGDGLQALLWVALFKSN